MLPEHLHDPDKLLGLDDAVPRDIKEPEEPLVEVLVEVDPAALDHLPEFLVVHVPNVFKPLDYRQLVLDEFIHCRAVPCVAKQVPNKFESHSRFNCLLLCFLAKVLQLLLFFLFNLGSSGILIPTRVLGIL